MTETPWHRSWPVIAIASLLVPPVGLGLLWMRPRPGAWLKAVVSVPLVVLTVAYTLLAMGRRPETDGSGMWPRFLRTDTEAHYEALERDRAAQRAGSPAPAASSRPPSAVAPAALESAGGGAGSRSGAEAAAELDDDRDTSTIANPRPMDDAVPGALDPPAAAYWTSFRGPGQDGRYTQQPVLAAWPDEGPSRLWRQPIGGGYASFAIASGRAFTIEQRREQEVVTSYDVATGRELWTHAWDGYFRESMGGDGPRATPTWHDGRIYALGAEGEFRCLDAETGEMLWRHQIVEESGATNLQWAMAASPLIVDDLVIVLPGGPNGRSVVAYDRITGDEVWAAHDDRQAYTTPMLVTLAGQRQLLVVSARRAMGLSVEDGALLWEYPWSTQFDINASQPVLLGDDRVFLSSGYGRGAASFRVVRAGAGFDVEPLWESIRMKNRFNSSVLHEGYLYGFDESILACIDAATGELVWKGGRYGYGQLVLAGDRLIVLTEGGDLVLVAASPDGHQELARFAAIEGKTWNHPAIADGRLLVRNTTEMAAFDIAAP